MMADLGGNGVTEWEYEFSGMCTNEYWNQWMLDWLKTLPDKRSVFVDYHEYTREIRFIITTRHLVNGKFLKWDMFTNEPYFRNKRNELTNDYHRFIINHA